MHFCFRNSLVIKATYSNPDGQQVKKTESLLWKTEWRLKKKKKNWNAIADNKKAMCQI